MGMAEAMGMARAMGMAKTTGIVNPMPEAKALPLGYISTKYMEQTVSYIQ